jgi:hypothetical protein
MTGIERMNTPLDPAAKKAYEVGYALFRVAAILPSRNFAELLEREALELLTTTVSNLAAEAAKTSQSLRYLLSFGRDTGNVHSENVELLIRQLTELESLIQDSAMNEISAADISDIFTARDEARDAAMDDFEYPVNDTAPEPMVIPATNEANNTNEANEAAGVPAAPLKKRQEIILERIRQSGNCRTRDLQAALPDLNERTLRYDLQRLVEQGKIERGGKGGPDSWYKAK